MLVTSIRSVPGSLYDFVNFSKTYPLARLRSYRVVLAPTPSLSPFLVSFSPRFLVTLFCEVILLDLFPSVGN